ncbi:DUF4836 family protein [Olleya sp. 1-3]|uniref:DUF4836 family protein n=1 Tax=Olleya sp. 1-3 TaxID=2058323 RepID=UPI000C320C43|nr:DUF4836 family protein [Olleya sp. 1-3]PKG51118.1 hypothetical protein CXF54_09415 [Olleya sp. 1-3]
MKKILSLLVASILLASCGTKNEESYFIPKDAVGVMYVNLKSLSEKSKALDMKNLNINTLIKDKAPKEIKDFVSEFMTSENLNNTFRKEFILGFGSIKRLSGFGGLALPIKDASAFETFITPMLNKIPNLEKETNVGKDNNFTIYSTKELAIGWNNKTALIIGAKNYAAAELIDLTNLDRQETILATNYFDNFFDTNQDIGLHITSSPLGDALDGILSAFAGMNINLENNNLSYYSSFEDDNVHSATKLKLNNDIKSLVGYDKWMTTSYNKKLLNVLPSNPVMLTKLSVDTETIYEHILSLKDNKSLPISIREELKKNTKRANRELEKDLGMDTQDFSKIFTGTVILTANKNDSPENKSPNIYTAIAIKDKAKFDRFFNALKEKKSRIKEISKNYYQLDEDILMVVTDDLIFMTNDGNKADEVKNSGKLAKNLSDFKHIDKLSHSLYFYSKGDFNSIVSKLYKTNQYNRSSRYTSFDNYDDFNSFSRGRKKNPIDNITDKSAELYEKYFEENHFYMDINGAESFITTKGDKNSLIQTILYGDEIAKLTSEKN